jgi:hypothetical protein
LLPKDLQRRGTNITRYTVLFCTVGRLVLAHSGCLFSGGVSTISRTTRASGSGFLSATERNGRWDADGLPPKVDEVTSRPIYHRLQKETAFSPLYVGKGYELSDPYPRRRYIAAAIREVGTAAENGSTVHYYKVKFDEEERVPGG